MITVIIPTMYKDPERLARMRVKYSNCPLIKNTIVIENHKDNKFVNPSWNMGVKSADTEWVVLANDDIELSDWGLLEVLKKSMASGCDLIGPGKSCFETPDTFAVTVAPEAKRGYGYGTFMILRKADYKPIDERIKIWRGDHHQFINASNPGVFRGANISTRMSTTIRSDEEFGRICQRDLKLYKQIYPTLPQ